MKGKYFTMTQPVTVAVQRLRLISTEFHVQSEKCHTVTNAPSAGMKLVKRAENKAPI